MRWIRWRITESVASFCLSLFTRLFSSPSQLIVLTWQSDLSQFVSMRCRASINNFSPLCSVLLPPLRFWWARSSLPSQYCQRSNTSWSYLKCILSFTTVPCDSRPGLLNLSTPLAFGAGRFFAAGVGGAALRIAQCWEAFSLHMLAAPSSPVATVKNVFGHCQMPLILEGGEKLPLV